MNTNVSVTARARRGSGLTRRSLLAAPLAGLLAPLAGPPSSAEQGRAEMVSLGRKQARIVKRLLEIDAQTPNQRRVDLFRDLLGRRGVTIQESETHCMPAGWSHREGEGYAHELFIPAGDSALDKQHAIVNIGAQLAYLPAWTFKRPEGTDAEYGAYLRAVWEVRSLFGKGFEREFLA